MCVGSNVFFTIFLQDWDLVVSIVPSVEPYNKIAEAMGHH